MMRFFTGTRGVETSLQGASRIKGYPMPLPSTAADRSPLGAPAFGGARPEHSPDSRIAHTAAVVRRIGAHLARLGLAVVIGWIGLLKFIPYEAEGVRGLIEN